MPEFRRWLLLTLVQSAHEQGEYNNEGNPSAFRAVANANGANQIALVIPSTEDLMGLLQPLELALGLMWLSLAKRSSLDKRPPPFTDACFQDLHRRYLNNVAESKSDFVFRDLPAS